MIFTIGHSRHSREEFISLLAASNIEVLMDIRSSPRSRFAQFNKRPLEKSMAEAGIQYVYRGDVLGGRFASPYHTYEDIAQTKVFRGAISDLATYATDRRVAVCCAEHDPVDCHRALLVGRALAEVGTSVSHILRDGTVETQTDFEDRLMKKVKIAEGSRPRPQLLIFAYRRRALKLGAA